MSDTRKIMNDIGDSVKKKLPDGFGFFVLVFPFNDDEARANYVSNANREDVVRVMEETVMRFKYKEDWLGDQ